MRRCRLGVPPPGSRAVPRDFVPNPGDPALVPDATGPAVPAQRAALAAKTGGVHFVHVPSQGFVQHRPPRVRTDACLKRSCYAAALRPAWNPTNEVKHDWPYEFQKPEFIRPIRAHHSSRAPRGATSVRLFIQPKPSARAPPQALEASSWRGSSAAAGRLGRCWSPRPSYARTGHAVCPRPDLRIRQHIRSAPG